MCDELSRNISGWPDATARFIFVCGAAGCAPLDVIFEKRPLATRWIILGNSEASGVWEMYDFAVMVESVGDEISVDVRQ